MASLSTQTFSCVGFAFAFTPAAASFTGTIDQESFSAVILALLLSVTYSPYALSFAIAYFEKTQKRMDDNIRPHAMLLNINHIHSNSKTNHAINYSLRNTNITNPLNYAVRTFSL